ncbi:hypothetical protein [Rhodovulum imhoffii]|uniref:hypothetical protein n=1 Tax=Rhodovulum imhoffii TaxID=365340 RepID=UPI0011B2636B|nr:hypothetical protein [Rhodovulum imhoffii]
MQFLETSSFSTPWYWAAMALMWWRAGAQVLGVPRNVIGRHPDEARARLDSALDRLRRQGAASGVWLAAGGGFAVALVGVLGFGGGLELLQALFFLLVPMWLAWLMDLSAAHLFACRMPEGRALRRALWRHRLYVQTVATVFVVLAVLWAMFAQTQASVLGA